METREHVVRQMKNDLSRLDSDTQTYTHTHTRTHTEKHTHVTTTYTTHREKSTYMHTHTIERHTPPPTLPHSFTKTKTFVNKF